ncbi:uncharacterized protein Gasu_12470 [Galdieria sulphuraria]|uniref:Uncharacterized protein n=1 Tax=Galdieria sulphuraria TaxID=130081 RepID=M2W6Y8_GALSU|nr:uncharacterized protein Gasu_12470 [Galdieria sulphuraria]EME31576.1 hypothetical protein Gasu_12470 [Galdieria sulphuraria]|eukprot:XP_005708096.1 hypothetical protein Gasu_12470 [Galdieria sulphuraria]
MDISAIITVVVWISVMILICGAFAGLRRNSCCVSRRLRVSRQTATSEREVTTGDIPYNSPPFVYLYNVSPTRLDTVAPELIYGSEESFLKQKPQLKALVTKRYFAKQLTEQEEKEEVFSNHRDKTAVSWGEPRTSSPSTEKVVLEEELKGRSVYDQDMCVSKPSLNDLVLNESEDKALRAFGELLESQTMCVICLEDFEKGCFVRIGSQSQCTALYARNMCLWSQNTVMKVEDMGIGRFSKGPTSFILVTF